MYTISLFLPLQWKHVDNEVEVAIVVIPLHLPVPSAISVHAASSSAHLFLYLCFSITKLTRTLVLHEHITSRTTNISFRLTILPLQAIGQYPSSNSCWSDLWYCLHLQRLHIPMWVQWSYKGCLLVVQQWYSRQFYYGHTVDFNGNELHLLISCLGHIS